MKYKSISRITAATLCLFLSLGCSSSDSTPTDLEQEVEAGREAVGRIENDPSIPPRQKRAMIDRIEMELQEQTGQAVELESTTEK